MPSRTPIVQTRNEGNEIGQIAWNRVVLEDENGDAIVAGNPLPVDIAGISVGAIAVNVVGASDTSAVVPVVLGGGAYATGDAVGALLEFENVARLVGGGVILTNLEITSLTPNVGEQELELWLFDRTITVETDNDPFSVSDADLLHRVCTITTANGAWFLTANQVASSTEMTKRVECLGTSLFGQFVTRGAPTFGVGDLNARLSFLQD